MAVILRLSCEQASLTPAASLDNTLILPLGRPPVNLSR
jgi:hypothetical protein